MARESLLEKVEKFYKSESDGALKLMDDVIRRAKRDRSPEVKRTRKSRQKEEPLRQGGGETSQTDRDIS